MRPTNSIPSRKYYSSLSRVLMFVRSIGFQVVGDLGNRVDRSVPMKSCEIKRVHQKRGGEGKQGRWTEIKTDMGERDEKKSFVRTCV